MKQDQKINSIKNIKFVDLPSIDWDASLKLASGKEKLAKHLYTIMITSLPEEKALINLAFNQKLFTNLREHIHKLRGGCYYTGFVKLQYIAKKLEQELVEQNINEKIDYDKMKQYINLINLEINWLISNKEIV